MDFFNARISYATAQLLQAMMDVYQEERGISITKAGAIALAYKDAKWVPMDAWDKIRDYEPADVPEADIKPAALKLKIPLEKPVEDALLQLKAELPTRLGASYVKMGVIISYILKAAYIKHFDEDAKRRIAPANGQSPTDIAFAKCQAELQALFGIDQAPYINASLNRLRKTIGV
ncbi:hypothetical protein [Lacticaseibacillus hulanensis]|uniref:hypothetical protein n=1 Tax=Lacticaseibacillus hulanensis TaxID=2493111 RepID=UPI000FD8C7BE|nr:hypothetical protein [Lacticaseibacillus hulanensis]